MAAHRELEVAIASLPMPIAGTLQETLRDQPAGGEQAVQPGKLRMD